MGRNDRNRIRNGNQQNNGVLTEASSSISAVRNEYDEFTPVATKLIPLLLDSGYLPKKSVLSCRRLNKRVKTILDRELLAIRKPAWLADAFTLKNRAAILKFMKKADGMLKSEGSLTPLFASVLNLVSGTDEPKTLKLLKTYGTHLINVRLAITLDEDRPMPFGTKANMISALRCLPNVFSLTLVFEQIAVDFYEMYWSDYEDTSTNDVTPYISPFTQFPELDLLSELTVELLSPISPEYEEYFLPPPIEFLQSLFKAYGPQLNKLTCHQFLLEDEEDEENMSSSQTLFNSHLKTLQDLTINGINVEGSEQVFKTLAEVNLPNLRRLALIKAEGVIFLDEVVECIFGEIDKELFLLLGRFRDSLEELRLYHLYAKGLNILETNFKTMHRLKGLTISSGNLNSDVWHCFRVHFPNLEWIRFEPSEEIEFFAAETSKKRRQRKCPTVPSLEVRNRFFSMFPMLKSIIWVQKQGMKVKRNGKAPKTLSFTRRVQMDVCSVQ